MDIPDESPWAPAPDIVRVEFLDSGEITPELTVGLLADIKQVQRERDAAIARAAQVRILRRLAHENTEWPVGVRVWLSMYADELEQESP